MIQKISGRQLILIGIVLAVNTTMMHALTMAAAYAKQHIWIAYLLAGAAILLSVWLLAKVLARFPNRDLFEAMISRFPYAGRVTAVCYILFFLFILAKDVRILVDFTEIVLLPKTPLTVVSAAVILSAVFMAYGGIEILGRVTEIYGVILLIALCFIVFMLPREYDFSLIMPFFDLDMKGILIGSWVIGGELGELILIVFIFSHQTYTFRQGLYALLISVAALIAIAMTTLLVLGIPIVSRFIYPGYELAKQIRLTDFLDRFDLPLVALWIPTMIAKIGYGLYAVCNGIRRIVPQASGQRLVAPVGLLALACSFWFFESATQLFNLSLTWPLIAGIFQLALPLLFFLVLRPRLKNNG